mmetsp:Transcript_91855/g.263070  ORF Transcript_91855/g.263070 Transcript_91855/m.263070 type:complete len:273 (+) Transcript_91855:370-1188(+)
MNTVTTKRHKGSASQVDSWCASSSSRNHSDTLRTAGFLQTVSSKTESSTKARSMASRSSSPLTLVIRSPTKSRLPGCSSFQRRTSPVSKLRISQASQSSASASRMPSGTNPCLTSLICTSSPRASTPEEDLVDVSLGDASFSIAPLSDFAPSATTTGHRVRPSNVLVPPGRFGNPDIKAAERERARSADGAAAHAHGDGGTRLTGDRGEPGDESASMWMWIVNAGKLSATWNSSSKVALLWRQAKNAMAIADVQFEMRRDAGQAGTGSCSLT